jgi:hypothetical protein
MISTSAPQFQTWRHFWHMSTLVHRTDSVSQPLPSHAYWWRNTRSKSAKEHSYKLLFDFSLLSCSQLASTGCKHRDTLDWSPHGYPARILSHNHYLPMCICEEMGGHTSQKCLIIHTQSTFRCLDALHFLPLAANIEVSRNQVHTGIQHTFCLITTTIACVFVKKQKVKSPRKARSYPHSRLFDAFMLSTSAPQFQTWRHFGHMSTQVHRTHSVS